MRKAMAGKVFQSGPAPKAMPMTTKMPKSNKRVKPLSRGNKKVAPPGVKVTGNTAIVSHPAQFAAKKATFAGMKRKGIA